MTEPVEVWWERRRSSTGRSVPYAVGTYGDAWRAYPVLVRQYHPDLNHGVVLSQVPLAADVWLQWRCDAGHRFVATPTEQRMRPGCERERRRSSWCPECLGLATGRAPRALPMHETAGVTAAEPAPLRVPAPRRPRPRRELCTRTPDLPVGEPFRSACAPDPASAVEAALRQALAARLEFDDSCNAVRLGRPFFDHLEAWPDILLPELRVAVEYDSTGRHGLEHVGRREQADARKDRALRAARWEVLRVRTGPLQPLGPHDLRAGGVSNALIDRMLDELRRIRGPLLVDCYLR